MLAWDLRRILSALNCPVSAISCYSVSCASYSAEVWRVRRYAARCNTCPTVYLRVFSSSQKSDNCFVNQAGCCNEERCVGICVATGFWILFSRISLCKGISVVIEFSPFSIFVLWTALFPWRGWRKPARWNVLVRGIWLSCAGAVHRCQSRNLIKIGFYRGSVRKKTLPEHCHKLGTCLVLCCRRYTVLQCRWLT